MGRTIDSIIYGNIFLTINGSDEAKKLAKELPSQNSKDFGIPFKRNISKSIKAIFTKLMAHYLVLQEYQLILLNLVKHFMVELLKLI